MPLHEYGLGFELETCSWKSEEEVLAGFPRIGTDEGFYPGFGRFSMDTCRLAYVPGRNRIVME